MKKHKHLIQRFQLSICKTGKLLLGGIIIAMASCNMDTNKQEKDTDSSGTHQDAIHEGHNHEGHEHAGNSVQENKREPLSLNNGMKWQADKVTEENVLVLHEIVESAKTQNLQTATEYNAIGQRLQAGTDKLIRDCKMTGPDHDALHIWLMPMINDINKLSSATEAAEAENIFVEIDKQLQNFNTYFE